MMLRLELDPSGVLSVLHDADGAITVELVNVSYTDVDAPPPRTVHPAVRTTLARVRTGDTTLRLEPES